MFNVGRGAFHRTVARRSAAHNWVRSMLWIGLVSIGPRVAAQYSVLTQHNDNKRTGAYLLEHQLTPQQVDPGTGPGMRMRYELWAGGVVNAQLLYLHHVRVADGTVHNVVLVATTANAVGAWDADTGVQLWNTALLDGDPDSGRTLTR